MSRFSDPTTRVAIALAIVPLACIAVAFYSKSSQTPAVVHGPLTALLLIGWLIMGIFEWKRIHRIGEVDLQIGTDAAFLTHHVTLGAGVVLLVATELYDALTPSLLNLFIAYMCLHTGAELLAKRRLT
jgi:hypothetical protein